MFTLSADSSPQTAPTTPSSVEDSNNSDEYLQPASGDLWNNTYGTHGQVLSSGSLDNPTDFVSGPSDFEMALGNTQAEICSLPLQDLIHDSVISNSPVATVNTPNMVPISTAWFSRLSPSSPSQNLLISSLASLPSPPPSATMDTSALFMPPQQQQQAQRHFHQPFSQQSVSAQLASGPMTMAPDAFLIKPQNSPGTRPPIQTTTNEHPGGRNPLKFEENIPNNTTISRWLLQVHDVPRKSRTETQVKLRVQLVDVSASASPFPDGSTGEPVTQYTHILVPNTPSVKTKARGVGDPDPSAVLALHAYIVCATVPEYQNKPVPCCESCQKRERNRNSKKKTGAGTASVKGRSAASSKNVTPATSTNATPATSDAEMYSAPSGSYSHAYPLQRDTLEEAGEGYVSPIDFTCNRLVDFSSGTASLSFRIVCYCRHYKEKTGFCVQLELRDSANRIVGKVKTTPIMIMDDHKSVSKLTPAHTADEEEIDMGTAKRRTKRIVSRHSESEARIKEEDGDDFEEGGVGAIRNKQHRLSRHSVLSQSAGSLAKLTSSKPVSASVNGPTISNAPSTSRSGPGHAHRHSHSYTHSESPLPTTAPSSPSVGFSPQPSHATGDASAKSEAEVNAFAPLQPFGTSIPLSTNDNLLLNNPLMQAMPNVNMALSGMTLSSPAVAMAPASNPFPHITRVMPASGPVQGGIEITLLGANFSPEALTTACIAFGENVVPFGPTVQIFSNSALICSLPPRSVAGPVEVKLLGVREMTPGMPSTAPIFTYTDEGDKDLMIHALQILGWQNSGQWQDPRSVAMGILGGGSSSAGMGSLMQADADMGFGGGFTFAAVNRNGVNARGPHQAAQPGGRRNVETLVLNVLRSARNPETGTINHLSAPHPATGQTILHRACALGYQTLVAALLGWGADVDLTDKNGFTPVHFSCFYGHLKCIDILVRQGRAHLEGRDHQGRTPLEVCCTEAAAEFIRDLEEEVETRRRRSTAPSEIESGGEGDDEGLSWSEADDDEDEDEDSERSGSVYAEEPPKPASRRISRVNSVASIVSNRKVAKSTTPFAPEPFSTIHSSATAPVPAPTRQPWWSMPLPGRGGAAATPRPDKYLKNSVDPSQTEQEQMFRWFREMRESWTIWRQQQQQQLDLEPPPSYTPSDPVSKLHLIAQEKLATGTAGTPAMPTELEEPPSPLSLDSQVEHVPTRTISRSTSNIRLRQQQIVYRRRADREVLGEQPHMHTEVGPRRAAKKRDTMLIYFWIPVLLAVFVWMSYKSIGLVYRSFTSHPLMRASAAFVQETV